MRTTPGEGFIYGRKRWELLTGRQNIVFQREKFPKK
jgi:hypothetical protein